MASVANVRRIGAFVAATAGTKPTMDDYEPTYHPVKWEVVAGSRMWHATFEFDMSPTNRMRFLGISASSTRQIEIWEIDPDLSPDIRVKPLFWGELTIANVAIGTSGEQRQAVATMSRYHFGTPIMGQRVRGVDLDDHTVQLPIAFNPMVDAAIVFNRWKPTGTTNDWYHWIDPESTRTEAALKYQDFESDPGEPLTHADNEEWDLLTAVETLCEIGNPDEDFVRNVAHGSYPNQIDAETSPAIRNQVYQQGAYLPDYLDVLCQRHGYNWTVDMSYDPDDSAEMKPQLRFFKQQDGVSRTVKLQDVGEVLSHEGTNTRDVSIVANIGSLSNIVTGFGALIEREMTIPLFKGWDEDDDGTHDHTDNNNPVGRKFVANEGGDYCDKRAELTEPTLFGATWTVKRRAVHDCLTLRDNVRRPAYVEYRDTDGGQPDILPVPSEWGLKILPDEIGIYFTGVRETDSDEGGIPEPVLSDTIELFITGTIRGDTRPTFTTAASTTSPNGNTIETVLDLSDRFFDRARMTGPYASTLTGALDDADDAAALEAYVETVRAESELADMSVSVVLNGLHFDDEYAIGDIVTKVEGREISFNRSTGTPGKYPQIVAIQYTNQPGNQTTTLALSPHGVA